jgi:hypothetical protein
MVQMHVNELPVMHLSIGLLHLTLLLLLLQLQMFMSVVAPTMWATLAVRAAGSGLALAATAPCARRLLPA